MGWEGRWRLDRCSNDPGSETSNSSQFGPVGTFFRGGCKIERRGANSYRVIGALVVWPEERRLPGTAELRMKPV